jgi:hypothetical protein
MTTSALIGIRAKLKWADAHLDQLKADFFASPKEPVNRLAYGGDADGLHATINTNAPAIEWALMAGNVIHQIRSSLDHLAFQLVLKHPRKIKAFAKARGLKRPKDLMRMIHFPIFKDAKHFSSDHRVECLKQLLTAREFAAIENAQPYNRNETAPTSDWLHILSALDNIDKHRTVLVIDKRASIEGGIEYSGVRHVGFNTGAQKVKPGEKFLTIAPALIRPDLKVKVDKVIFYLTFADTEGTCDDAHVIDTLRHIRRDVEDLIESKFARFLQ